VVNPLHEFGLGEYSIGLSEYWRINIKPLEWQPNGHAKVKGLIYLPKLAI
jgi:hypothetical protein